MFQRSDAEECRPVHVELGINKLPVCATTHQYLSYQVLVPGTGSPVMADDYYRYCNLHADLNIDIILCLIDALCSYIQVPWYQVPGTWS